MTDCLVAYAASGCRGLLRYRVDVVGPNIDEVIDGAGGWIYDFAMQGWSLNVVIPRHIDTRPTDILGASVNQPLRTEHNAPQVFLHEAAETVPVTHRLSTAARLFKTQALIAARLAPSTEGHETLFVRAPVATLAVEVGHLRPVTAFQPS